MSTYVIVITQQTGEVPSFSLVEVEGGVIAHSQSHTAEDTQRLVEKLGDALLIRWNSSNRTSVGVPN